MRLAHAVGRLDGDLRLPDAAEALDDGPLARVPVRTWRDPFEKLLQNRLSSHKVLVPTKSDKEVR